MKQKINYKYVCLLMMLITVCLFGCSQTVMAAADDSITCGLSKESRSSAVVQKSRHTSNVNYINVTEVTGKPSKTPMAVQSSRQSIQSPAIWFLAGQGHVENIRFPHLTIRQALAFLPKTADIIWYCLKHPWIVHHLLSPDRQNLTEFIWLETPGLLIQSVH